MIKIWGRANSVNVQKVLWCADELGLIYERVDAGGNFGVVTDEPFLKMNPHARVPVLEDEDYSLWESNSIVRYLAAKYGAETLWSHNPRERGLAERWMDWQLGSLSPGMTVLFWSLVRTPPERRDPARIEQVRAETALLWQVLDRFLGEHEYVSGRRFSIGDIPAGAMAWRWFKLPIERPETPNLKRWFSALQRRPPYKKWVMVEMS